jgi:GAF domain-containing protein
VSAPVVVLLALAGWAAVSVLTTIALMPLLRILAQSESYAQPGEPAPRSRLRDSGYLGIVMERLVLHAGTIFGADQVCVFGRDPRARDDALVLVQGAGVNPELIGRRLAVDWDPLVAALACGRPLAVRGDLWPAWEGELGGANPTRSAAIAPVWFGGRIRGALTVTHGHDDLGLDVRALSLVGELAELAGRVLEHTEGRQLSVADPQPEIDGLLATLSRAAPGAMRLEMEVAGTARRLADDLGLGEADLVEVELAARLRNVGRLRAPARLLRGAGVVTPEERELLRLQPRWGAGMVARIPGLEAVALIVRLAHERWDGSGYPEGLAGERIPLASRIVALSAASAAAPLELDARARSGFDPDLIACLGGAAAGAGVAGPV